MTRFGFAPRPAAPALPAAAVAPAQSGSKSIVKVAVMLGPPSEALSRLADWAVWETEQQSARRTMGAVVLTDAQKNQ